MAKFVDYKEVPLVDKNYWKVESELVRDGKGYVIGWNVEYEAVWDDENKIVGWKPKAVIYARDASEIKVDKEGTKPAEKRGLYDLCIDNHIDIPDGISKDSPCYKQFMKEKEMNK